jgi:hypothetical protein
LWGLLLLLHLCLHLYQTRAFRKQIQKWKIKILNPNVFPVSSF